jgi:hypothetical protein
MSIVAAIIFAALVITIPLIFIGVRDLFRAGNRILHAIKKVRKE